MARLGSYLRMYRRQSRLTEGELAFLFGYEAASIVSRLEQQQRTVTLAVAYASELIFGAERKEIFPALFESIEESILYRLYHLYDTLLQGEPTHQTLAKLELLREALGRFTAPADQQEA